MPQSTRKMLRVGYWMSEKKIRKLNFPAYCDRLRRDHDIDMILLSLDRALEQQGPFDLVMHKLTDVMAAADAGDKISEAAVKRAEEYFNSHPTLRLLDPLSAVRNVTDRDTCYSLMRACTKTIGGVEIASPNFATILSDTTDKAEALRSCNVSFPIVCKPIVAHGSDLAHKMAIIFNEEHLCDMQTPCVAQQFVNHSALLHKVFVIGECHYIVQRPSIKNLIAGDHETIFFDSHDVSKATSDSYLNQMERRSCGLPTPSEGAIEWLVKRLRKTMSLNLFGVDIIIENDTNRHIFIDVNYFPGYDGVTDMLPAFTRLMQSHRYLSRSPSSDSGLSSDSVDNHSSSTTSSATCSDAGGRECHYSSTFTPNGQAVVMTNGLGRDALACNGASNGGELVTSPSDSCSSGCSVVSPLQSGGCVPAIPRELLPVLASTSNGGGSGGGGHDEVADSIKAKRPCDYDSAIVDGTALPNGHHSTLHVAS